MREDKKLPKPDPKLSEISRKIDEHCTDVIMKHTVPKFEGLITPGKLELAGIKVINQPSTKRVWVEQNGEMIGSYYYWGEIILST